MGTDYKRIALLFTAVFMPAIAMAAVPVRENLSVQIWIISILNTILLGTSIISIIQFFLRDGHNRTPFHIFNILFMVVFYAISLTFLVYHKAYFEGYENLSDKNALIKYFLDKDIFSVIKLLIPVALVFNVVYIVRYSRSYYLE